MSGDPEKSAAVAAEGQATQERSPERADGAAIEGPEKPELYVAAAFAGAFLFARILRKIAE